MQNLELKDDSADKDPTPDTRDYWDNVGWTSWKEFIRGPDDGNVDEEPSFFEEAWHGGQTDSAYYGLLTPQPVSADILAGFQQPWSEPAPALPEPPAEFVQEDFTRRHPPPLQPQPNDPGLKVILLYMIPGYKGVDDKFPESFFLIHQMDAAKVIEFAGEVHGRQAIKQRYYSIMKSIFVVMKHYIQKQESFIISFPPMDNDRTFILNELVAYSNQQLYRVKDAAAKEEVATWAQWEGNETLTPTMHIDQCLDRAVSWTLRL